MCNYPFNQNSSYPIHPHAGWHKFHHQGWQDKAPYLVVVCLKANLLLHLCCRATVDLPLKNSTALLDQSWRRHYQDNPLNPPTSLQSSPSVQGQQHSVPPTLAELPSAPLKLDAHTWGQSQLQVNPRPPTHHRVQHHHCLGQQQDLYPRLRCWQRRRPRQTTLERQHSRPEGRCHPCWLRLPTHEYLVRVSPRPHH